MKNTKRPGWSRLDNAAKVFPALANKKDSRVFRFACQLTEPVQKKALQQAAEQALVNAKVPNHKKESYMEYSEIAEAIGELEKKFAGEGRVLIRPSGTEPLVRVMIEGKNQEVIQQEAKQLADLITKVML